MTNRLAVFDMDGTVVDSIPMLTELAVQTIMTTYGWNRQRARVGYEKTLGLPFIKQLDQLFPNDPLNEKAAASYTATHLAVARLFPVAPGFIDFMLWIQEQPGWHAALVSSTHHDIIHQMPQVLALGFAEVEGWAPDFHKDWQVTHAATMLHVGLNKHSVVYFGDTLMDNVYADRLGVRFQYVTPESVSAVARIVVGDMGKTP